MINLETKAHRLHYLAMIDGQIRQLIRPNSRVQVVIGGFGKGEANATVKAIYSTFSGDDVAVSYLPDNETELKTIKIK